MALFGLLLALAAALLQLSAGQQIVDGNNLAVVASHKLAAIKQQSQKQNSTDLTREINSDQSLVLKDESLETEQTNLNNSVNSGSTITSIKFVRNPAYDGPMPSFALVSSQNGLEPVSETAQSQGSMPLPTALSNSVPSLTSQVTTKQTGEKAGLISKSPVLIGIAPRASNVGSPQSSYFISALPTQSPQINMASMQPTSAPAPSMKQQPHQTVTSVQYQPSNVQKSANMRLRFVPAQSSVQIQQNTVPIQSIVPIPNTVPLQNTLPIQNTLSLRNALPIQNAVPGQDTVAIQKTSDSCNIVQNPNLSPLLSHLLSQSLIKRDHPTPAVIRQSQDQKPSKQSTIQTLIPLILQLLAEKNCCECKNERPRTYSRYKQGRKQMYDKFCASPFEMAMMSDAADHFHRFNHNKRYKKPLCDNILEEDEYSNESVDYSDEDYDDED